MTGDDGESPPSEQGSGPTPSEAPPRKHRPDAGAPLSPTVKLTFRTFPARRASVSWGTKRLGWTDRGKWLVVERPRDSGPLDVIVRARDFLPVHARAELVGGDARRNAEVLTGVLGGERGAFRDTTLLNAAAALVVAGRTADLRQAVAIAADAIDSGRALAKLEALRS